MNMLRHNLKKLREKEKNMRRQNLNKLKEKKYGALNVVLITKIQNIKEDNCFLIQ